MQGEPVAVRATGFSWLLDRDALGEVAWFVHIRPSRQRRVVREQLKRNDVENR